MTGAKLREAMDLLRALNKNIQRIRTSCFNNNSEKN